MVVVWVKQPRQPRGVSLLRQPLQEKGDTPAHRHLRHALRRPVSVILAQELHAKLVCGAAAVAAGRGYW